jgi:hypothetical protein
VEENNIQELQIQDGVYIDDIIGTLEIPEIENPEEREYENIITENEGGL